MGTRPHSRLAHPITGHPSCEGRSSRRYAFLARGLLGGGIPAHRRGHGAHRATIGRGAVRRNRPGRAARRNRSPTPRPAGDRHRPLHGHGVTAANRTISKYGERVTAPSDGDVTNLDFSDASFDLIVTTFSMHHWDDVPAPVPELARVLRPGGALYVYDLPHAPFDTLDAAAQTKSLLTVRPVQHNVIHTGRPHIRRCIRHVLTTDTTRADKPHLRPSETQVGSSDA